MIKIEKMKFSKLEALLNLGQKLQPSFPFLGLYILLLNLLPFQNVI